MGRMLKNRLSEERAKTLLDKHLRPSNIPMLVSSRVSQHIWMKLKHERKRMYLRLGQVRERLVKSLLAITRVIVSLTALKAKVLRDTRKEIKAITKATLEAVQIGTLAIHELNQRRCTEMKYDLHASYRGLCNPPEEEGEHLFGGNLNDRVRELNEVRRMGHQVTEGGFRRNSFRRPFLG